MFHITCVYFQCYCVVNHIFEVLLFDNQEFSLVFHCKRSNYLGALDSVVDNAIKEKEILTLIENLESLQGEITPLDRQRLSKIAKIASYFAVLLSCLYPSLWVIGHIFFNESRCPFDARKADIKA
ncbi:hypothetical protein CEXT_481861 [Caerostris extrusa]|uniref:Uncharacterized protein n=1 Tax=Caerostris extrusa TaxID=172846 RepID=A0AAV4UFA1_CAEEX|nr:hypothetical protein CEXT_481861 [Caerostris extrusa]